jgi:hypothetical protein
VEDNFGRGQGSLRTVMPEEGGGGGEEEEEINHSGNLHRKCSPVTFGYLSVIIVYTQPRAETTVLCRAEQHCMSVFSCV